MENVTKDQMNRLRSYWVEITKDNDVEIETIRDTIYCFCSELSMLRLLAKYTNNGENVVADNITMGFSVNLSKHYFAIDRGREQKKEATLSNIFDEMDKMDLGE